MADPLLLEWFVCRNTLRAVILASLSLSRVLPNAPFAIRHF